MKISEPLQSYNGLEIYDILRSFKGDSSARQFEAGHQKGGNFFCIACLIHANNVKNIASSFRKKVLSIEDRVEKVKCTTNSVSRLEGKSLKLYDNLRKPDIIDELHQRIVRSTSSLSQKQLMDLLLYEMHDIHRLPSLLYDYPHQDLEELNLSQYEILPTEPLHNISNHIKNIYQELPFHVDKAEKSLVTKAIERSLNGKEAKIL